MKQINKEYNIEMKSRNDPFTDQNYDQREVFLRNLKRRNFLFSNDISYATGVNQDNIYYNEEIIDRNTDQSLNTIIINLCIYDTNINKPFFEWVRSIPKSIDVCMSIEKDFIGNKGWFRKKPIYKRYIKFRFTKDFEN